MEKLNSNFIAELFKLMLVDLSTMKICSTYLNFKLIPKELGGFKVVLKEALDQFEKYDKLPSVGSIAQKYNDNLVVQDTIKEIKNAQLVDKEVVIDQLESYIRDTEFQILNKRVYDLYNEGKKDESIRLNSEESQRILSISLRKSGGKFKRIFRDFSEIIQENKKSDEENTYGRKIPFGIDKLDELTLGGAELGDTVLWIMRSGVGKSTVLRYQGMSAAMIGVPVLHVQLEGGMKNVTNKYTQMWTNQSYNTIRKGDIPEKEWKKIQKTLKEMNSFERDIDVYSFEKFEDATVLDVRNLILEYEKIYGYFPKLLIVDSLDLLLTGNNKLDSDPKYKKDRLQTCAQKLKNIAVEFDLVCTTATQTGDIPIEIWNNEDRVIDRSNTEGDRTLVKPFSFVFTGNMTIEEKQKKLARIFFDKTRDVKNNNEVVYIATNYEKGRFYDRAKSMLIEESVKTLKKIEPTDKNPRRKMEKL